MQKEQWLRTLTLPTSPNNQNTKHSTALHEIVKLIRHHFTMVFCYARRQIIIYHFETIAQSQNIIIATVHATYVYIYWANVR